MTNDNIIELSRRKVLAGIGTVGVASAGAGLGTTAFFSDEETFEGNTLTAGKLDLKMDWQEHYSDWSSDEEQYAGMASDSSSADYELPGGSAGESILLDFTDQSGFMAATSIEAFPDKDNDGVNDYDTTLESYTESPASDPGDICTIGADTPEDLDPTTSHRTKNPDTYDEEKGEYKPLIALDDVKPGDFGEVTFSLHLCDNPGYLWMFAENVSGSENGYTEPERKDSDETGDADGDGTDDTVELLDKIQARAWYDGAGHIGGDSGNNLKDDGEKTIVGPASLRTVLENLTSNPGVPLSAANFTEPHCGAHDSSNGIDDASTFTCIESTSVNPDCESQGFGLGVKFDESELPDKDGTYHTITKTVTVDGTDFDFSVEVKVTAEDDGQPQKLVYQNLEVDENEAGAGLVIVKGGPNANLCTPDDGPASGSGSYELHPPINPNTGNPYAISHIDFCIANDVPPPEKPPRTCLVNSTTVYVGFEWWLPINHGNEVQTDSVSFDLGFYTEQCRHNDGTGMQRQ